MCKALSHVDQFLINCKMPATLGHHPPMAFTNIQITYDTKKIIQILIYKAYNTYTASQHNF
jgi:hypothetical protein